MMKCFYFYYFKYRNQAKSRRSAPVFNNLNLSEVSETEIGTKSSRSAPSPRSIPDLYQERARNLRVFKFSELRHATNNFSNLLKVGEGGFGCVYKGTISASKGDTCDRVVVAIKKLKPDGYEGHKQWVAEVQFLGVVEHPNLVKLIGYCAVNGEIGIQRLLVYEYMTNKSLDDHLFNKAYRTICWDCRLQIVLGAARGLAYLHEELETQVIYRDFKSSNVLLNDTFHPKLSDFGLAREGPAAGHTHVSTAVVGTYGYAAPDYIQTGHLSSKSDVWSFGIVLYEVLTGRRSVERHRPKPEQRLLDWVKQYRSRKFDMIMDPRLESEYSVSQARLIAKLADSCLVKNPKERPKMSVVVNELERIVRYSGPLIPEDYDESAAEVRLENHGDGALESAKRRISHLAKIGEQVVGGSKRKLVIMTTKEA